MCTHAVLIVERTSPVLVRTVHISNSKFGLQTMSTLAILVSYVLNLIKKKRSISTGTL